MAVPYNTELIETLSMILIITSVAAVESQNLKRAAAAYCLQALLICGLILAFAAGNSALYVWAATAFITKAILTPWFLLRYIAKTGEKEVPAIVGFGPSVVIASVLLVSFYKLTHTYVHVLAPTPEAIAGVFRTNLAVALTVFVLGLYAILSRRDAIKTVIGLRQPGAGHAGDGADRHRNRGGRHRLPAAVRDRRYPREGGFDGHVRAGRAALVGRLTHT